MDTGSGKTYIAIMRIMEEFKLPQSIGKLAWFLCPSVALAHQQYKAVCRHLPSLLTRLIVGDDGVDHWKTQAIWDAILENIQVVVSTYQILHDALKHGFVRMEKLALLVIDEAHNCFDNTPVNKIMQNFYHPEKVSGNPVPSVLGLTASPVISSSINEMKKIETNLDAICRSPKFSREELLKITRRPQMVFVPFPPPLSIETRDQVVSKFQLQYECMDMTTDPHVAQLVANGQDKTSEKYRKAFSKRKTFVCEQLRSLISNSQELSNELGTWASSRYLNLCHMDIKKRLDLESDPLHLRELEFLGEYFRKLDIPSEETMLTIPEDCVSIKLRKLVDILRSELQESSAGIVFVKTRATVNFLAAFLVSEPSLKSNVRLGTFVGLSKGTGRSRTVGENMEQVNQMETLQDLRTGAKNLIVSTNACEEGIDISACNVVICYDNPSNLKSFIQRRGRARAKDSKYFIMHEDQATALKKNWVSLEEDMKKEYLNELRNLRELDKLESSIDGYRDLHIKETGAKITLEDAVSHLDHFCNKLPTTKFAMMHPVYSFSETVDGHVCTVELPNSVDSSLRFFRSSHPWPTERLAKKDAALEAYTALYRAGLVNKNLLPEPVIDEEVEEAMKDSDNREKLVNVTSQLDPMVLLSQNWGETSTIYRYIIRLSPTRGQGLGESETPKSDLMFGLPCKIEISQPLTLFWDRDIVWSAKIEFHSEATCHHDYLHLANEATDALMRPIFNSRMDEGKVGLYPILFFPSENRDDLSPWIHEVKETVDLNDIIEKNVLIGDDKTTTFRQKGTQSRPMRYLGAEHREVRIGNGMEETEMKLCFKLEKLPSRRDFLHQIIEKGDGKEQENPERDIRYMPVDSIYGEKMPFSTAKLALLIPSFMHHIGKAVLASHFRSQFLLRDLLLEGAIAIERIDLILEALTASSAREPVDYQKLEFLGDAILGYYTAMQVSAKHSKWHEGYLTMAKSGIVSNSRLSKVTRGSGLSKYIISSSFTGLKWTPPTIEKLLNEAPDRSEARNISTKTLADVVEALLGAAFVESSGKEKHESGSIPTNVRALLKQLIPSARWLPPSELIEILRESTDATISLPPHFSAVEELIEFKFSRPALLIEALTHPSYTSSTSVSSYQRLEFLGDSVLQVLVTRYIMKHDLAVPQMHLLRTAAVNNQLLAFKAMSLVIPVTKNELVKPEAVRKDKQDGGFTTKECTEDLSLHDFLFHGPSHLFAEAKAESLRRFKEHKDDISQSLHSGRQYPWNLLAKFGPEKMFGDIVESVLGAILIDSGDEQECSKFLQRLGIWDLLDRMIRDKTRVMQPKQEIGIVAAASQHRVKYKVKAVGSKFSCYLSVGSKTIGVGEGRRRMEAETLAATDALRRIEERGSIEDVEPIEDADEKAFLLLPDLSSPDEAEDGCSEDAQERTSSVDEMDVDDMDIDDPDVGNGVPLEI